MKPRHPLALLGTIGAWACGGGLALVPTGPHALEARHVQIDEPPPPAKVERIPERPESTCFWLDGYWEWTEGSWRWVPGAWVLPPARCYFAPPTTVWTTSAEGGALYLKQGRWYPESGAERCPEARRCETRTLLGVDEEP